MLAAEPMRYLHDLNSVGEPEWIAMEEVPDVLPLWKQYAVILRRWGFSVWTGILNAADYGVPQTRRRAILLASRVRTAQPPPPTHAKNEEPEGLFGPGRARWVSMAQALGWGATDRPVPTVCMRRQTRRRRRALPLRLPPGTVHRPRPRHLDTPPGHPPTALQPGRNRACRPAQRPGRTGSRPSRG